jgi:hypothetical protein
MTRVWQTGTGRESAFETARAHERHQLVAQRDQAARTVAQQAVDAEDCRRLLSMLGLDGEPPSAPAH